MGSATTTQKVPYSSISKIEATPIDGQEEYVILTLTLGSANSKMHLYFYPAQVCAGALEGCREEEEGLLSQGRGGAVRRAQLGSLRDECSRCAWCWCCC